MQQRVQDAVGSLVSFVANFLDSVLVKEFLKTANIWWAYELEYSVTLFWLPVYLSHSTRHRPSVGLSFAIRESCVERNDMSFERGKKSPWKEAPSELEGNLYLGVL